MTELDAIGGSPRPHEPPRPDASRSSTGSKPGGTPIQIVPYTAQHVEAVAAFNTRLSAGAVRERYRIGSLMPESPVPAETEPDSGRTEEAFLAVEGHVVRGGYGCRQEDFLLRGEVVSIGFPHQPISEGTINPGYALVAARLLRHALARQPLLYGLGLGGYDEAVTKLLVAAGFRVATVPFFFRVEHASRFLTELPMLRTSTFRRLAGRLAGVSGLGRLVFAVRQRRRAPSASAGNASAYDFDSFGEWADRIWAANVNVIAFTPVRNRNVLRYLYDQPQNRFLKVAITSGGDPVGWAVCLVTAHRDHRYFGNLVVGSIVDLLAVPGYERALVIAALNRLRQERVDLIVTNQSFEPIARALTNEGFASGPSNFLFAASPRLANRLGSLDEELRRMHLNRGGGDGPINL